MAAIPFQNAVAVVTGGASGLGKAICEELGRRGAFVVVTDVQDEGAWAVASGMASAGGGGPRAARGGRLGGGRRARPGGFRAAVGRDDPLSWPDRLPVQQRRHRRRRRGAEPP